MMEAAEQASLHLRCIPVRLLHAQDAPQLAPAARLSLRNPCKSAPERPAEGPERPSGLAAMLSIAALARAALLLCCLLAERAWAQRAGDAEGFLAATGAWARGAQQPSSAAGPLPPRGCSPQGRRHSRSARCCPATGHIIVPYFVHADALPTAERELLLSFKRGISNWEEAAAARGLAGWCDDGAACISVCSWSGVQCDLDGTGHVTEL